MGDTRKTVESTGGQHQLSAEVRADTRKTAESTVGPNQLSVESSVVQVQSSEERTGGQDSPSAEVRADTSKTKRKLSGGNEEGGNRVRAIYVQYRDSGRGSLASTGGLHQPLDIVAHNPDVSDTNGVFTRSDTESITEEIEETEFNDPRNPVINNETIIHAFGQLAHIAMKTFKFGNALLNFWNLIESDIGFPLILRVHQMNVLAEDSWMTSDTTIRNTGDHVPEKRDSRRRGGRKKIKDGKTMCLSWISKLLSLTDDRIADFKSKVTELVQDLIDGRRSPAVFVASLNNHPSLRSSTRPIVPFLEKTLPDLQYALLTGEMTIKGVSPPPPNTVLYSQVIKVPAPRATNDKSLPGKGAT